MKYYLYQITNLINGKIYIGVHRTENLDDGYMGSGLLIRKAISKYGIENFRKDILEYFDSLEDMFLREAEIVDKNFLSREDVYNIVEGGNGRFPEDATWRALAAKTPESMRENAYATHRKVREKYGETYHSPKMKAWVGSAEHKSQLIEACRRAQTAEAREKRKYSQQQNKHQQGEKNSQFGTMWITDGVQNKKVRKNDPIPDGWKKGRFIGDNN